MERGVLYFALEIENKVVGCVACEKASSNVCYLERLAVLLLVNFMSYKL